ncbi:hypothetical protein QR680_005705 [Steinernema hermaphroditum]|uniref:Uncharacterized protein n=1 Tax=Steinernema hermaphroditum TaxID=289476 RepID=A0AA39HT42_9BILA|nr:hypothetical protein QR680_005705 [Steinernema hermaphroditum]
MTSSAEQALRKCIRPSLASIRRPRLAPCLQQSARLSATETIVFASRARLLQTMSFGWHPPASDDAFCRLLDPLPFWKWSSAPAWTPYSPLCRLGEDRLSSSGPFGPHFRVPPPLPNSSDDRSIYDPLHHPLPSTTPCPGGTPGIAPVHAGFDTTVVRARILDLLVEVVPSSARAASLRRIPDSDGPGEVQEIGPRLLLTFLGSIALRGRPCTA